MQSLLATCIKQDERTELAVFSNEVNVTMHYHIDKMEK